MKKQVLFLAVLCFLFLSNTTVHSEESYLYISGTKNELVWGNLDDVAHLPNGNQVAWIYQINDNPRIVNDTIAFEMELDCNNQKARILQMKEFSLSLVKKSKPVNSEFVDIQASIYLRFFNHICGHKSADEKLIFAKKNMNELRLFTLKGLELIRKTTGPTAKDKLVGTYQY